MDKNSLGYIRLAMLRNDKLNSMHIVGLDKDRITWMEYNRDLVRIENGILASLGNLKGDGRATLYENVVEAQQNSEFEICRLNAQKRAGEDDLKKLTDATKIKEASDYLELLLQIHYPQEFPNPLVDEVLKYIRADKPAHETEQIPYSSTYTQMVMGKTEEIMEGSPDLIEDEVQEDIADTSQELSAISSTQETPHHIEGIHHSLEDYQPKVISLFEKYRESQTLNNTQLPPNDFGTSNPVLDDGLSQ